MRRAAVVAALGVLVGAGGFAWGVQTVREGIFPYRLLVWAANRGARPDRHGGILARAAMQARYAPDVEVVFLGDSLTEAGPWADAYPALPSVNRGLWGDRIRDMTARLDVVAASRPGTVVVMAGINDLLKGASVEAAASDYAALLEGLEALGPSRIVLQSVLPCDRPGCDPERIAALNRRVAALAEASAVAAFADVAGALSEGRGLRPGHAYDGLHLTAEGYAAWIEALRPHL